MGTRDDKLYDLMEKLSAPISVSGNEGVIRRELLMYCDAKYTERIDHIGNLIWTNSKKIKYLFTAHMDEIGLMVTGYDKHRLKIAAVGGIDPRTLPNTQWVSEDGFKGVIGLPAPHITKDKDKVVPIEDLRIDTGFEENIEDLFPIGTTFVSDNAPFRAGDSFFSRNTDNRAGCAALVRLSQELKDVEGVAFAFLVREEVGLMGARAFINNELNAEYIINLDVCVSDKLGDGAVISIKDGGYMADRGMIESFRSMGVKNFEVGAGGTSDHAVGQLFAKTCGVSFPSLYIHSGVSKVNLGDIQDAINICIKYVEETNDI